MIILVQMGDFYVMATSKNLSSAQWYYIHIYRYIMIAIRTPGFLYLLSGYTTGIVHYRYASPALLSPAWGEGYA